MPDPRRRAAAALAGKAIVKASRGAACSFVPRWRSSAWLLQRLAMPFRRRAIRARSPFRVLFATSLALIAASLPAQEVSADEAAFDEGLAGVHALMKKARWADARSDLLQLLKDHEGKVYVQAQCDALVHDYRSCTFFAQATVPELQDLVKGEVASFTPRTGKIKLIYDNRFDDWEASEDGTFLVHPMVFAGSYTVTLESKAYPANRTVRALFDMDPSGTDFYVVDLGLAPGDFGQLDATIEKSSDGKRPSMLDRARSNAEPNEAFKAILKVAEKKVSLTFNRKALVRAKRDDASFGQFAFWKGDFDAITFDGKIEPSWYQSMVDASLTEQRAKFDESFDAQKELPKWLFTRPKLPRTAPQSSFWLPGETFSDALGAVLQSWRNGRISSAAHALAELTDEQVEDVTRRFLDASLKLAAGQVDAASKVSSQLVTERPELALYRCLHAEVLDALGKPDEAIAELQTALKFDPGGVANYEALVVALMRMGRNDEAARVVRAGKTKAGLWEDLGALDQLLAMAARGPSFSRSHSYRTKHYEVVSDIDGKVCAEAARILERSYANLGMQFSWLREQRNAERFRVFLFSGEPGYQEYNQKILGSTVPHTAGLYSPVLKQLLIWNLPKREDMERTVRHEGFHQFLDRLMHNPPTWLNEGTAEYWETARYEGGRFTGGQVRKDHIATLIRSRKMLPSLQEFVYGGRGDFYANAQQRYAQAWALVHFLRESDRDNAKRFDELWKALSNEGATCAALDLAFAGVDWKAFENAFWQHLRSLKN